MPAFFEVNHPDVQRVDRDIFTLTFTPDCMSHQCRCRDDDDDDEGDGKNGRKSGGKSGEVSQRNDACCRYGADVLIPEKQAILRRAPEIAAVLEEGRRDPAGWFDERDPETDPDAPAGIILRTATSDLDDATSGCVFLEHTGERGCGLHRAALLHGFSPAEIKPLVCRLYPLSWTKRRLGLSPDFSLYSCANDSGPTIYRLMRGVLGEIFGPGLLRELDRSEAKLQSRRLRVLPRSAVPRENAID